MRILVIAIALSTVFAPTTAATMSVLSGDLASHGTLGLSGALDTEAQQAVVHVPGLRSASAMELRAERFEMVTDWERGVRAGPGEGLAAYTIDWGRETTELTEAELFFTPWGPGSQVLVFGDGAHRLDLAGTAARVQATAEGRLVSVGWSSSSQSAGNISKVGFSYSLDQPVLEYEGVGTTTITGSFSLFVNNATIRGREAHGDRWQGWAGYEESRPDQPMSEYERRVTLIHVSNGTLALTPSVPIELFASALRVQIRGVLVSNAMTGNVTFDDGRVSYEREPMVMDGEGTIVLRMEELAERGQRGQTHATSDAVLVQPSGAFQLVQTASHGPPIVPSQRTEASTLWVIIVLALGILALAGLALAVGRGRRPVAALWDRAYRHLMSRGRSARLDGRHDTAAFWYRQATRVRRDAGAAWFAWALAELDAGDPVAAERVANRARSTPGVDRLDILELRAATAMARGDLDALKDHVEELARAEPAMARSLLKDLGVDPGSLGLSALRVKNGHDRRDFLDAYA